MLSFKDLLHTMDSRYTVPSRVTINTEVGKVLIEFVKERHVLLTGYFYSRKDCRRHRGTLAVRCMPSHLTQQIISMTWLMKLYLSARFHLPKYQPH